MRICWFHWHLNTLKLMNHTSNLCAYFQDSSQLLCWLARFCNTITHVWKSTENLPLWYNQHQSKNEVEAWQEFELQLRLIYLPVSYVCSVSKWRRCRRLKALCTKKKDKTTQMPRSVNRIPTMRGFRTKTCLPITMVLFQKIWLIQFKTIDRSCCCCCCRDTNLDFDFTQDCLKCTSRKSLWMSINPFSLGWHGGFGDAVIMPTFKKNYSLQESCSDWVCNTTYKIRAKFTFPDVKIQKGLRGRTKKEKIIKNI